MSSRLHHSADVKRRKDDATPIAPIRLVIGQPFCPTRTSYGSWLPDILTRRGVVSRGAAACYARLTKRVKGSSTTVTVTAKELASELDCNIRNIWNYLKQLQAKGLIVRQRRGRTLSNTYTFLFTGLLTADIRPGYVITQEPESESAQLPLVSYPSAPDGFPPPQLPAPIEPIAPPPIAVPFPPAPVPAAPPAPATVAAAPPEKPAPRKSTTVEPKMPEYRNPLPESDPYREAVGRISEAAYFKVSSLIAWQEASRCFHRMELPPELADEVADFVLYDGPKSYNVRTIAEGCARVLQRNMHLERATAQPESVTPLLDIESKYADYQSQEAMTHIAELTDPDRQELRVKATSNVSKTYRNLRLMPAETQEKLIWKEAIALVLPRLQLQSIDQYAQTLSAPRRKAPEREHTPELARKAGSS